MEQTAYSSRIHEIILFMNRFLARYRSHFPNEDVPNISSLLTLLPCRGISCPGFELLTQENGVSFHKDCLCRSLDWKREQIFARWWWRERDPAFSFPPKLNAWNVDSQMSFWWSQQLALRLSARRIQNFPHPTTPQQRSAHFLLRLKNFSDLLYNEDVHWLPWTLIRPKTLPWDHQHGGLYQALSRDYPGYLRAKIVILWIDVSAFKIRDSYSELDAFEAFIHDINKEGTPLVIFANQHLTRRKTTDPKLSKQHGALSVSELLRPSAWDRLWESLNLGVHYLKGLTRDSI